MGELWFCINLFMEEQLLPGCLDSIKRNHPEAKIVAVDGCYQSWSNEIKKLAANEFEYGRDVLAKQLLQYVGPRSTDRTLEILREYKVDVIIENKNADPVNGEIIPWEHEYTKRSQYFVGKTGDWYFVIDGDERLEGKVDLSKLTDRAYNVDLVRDDGVTPYPILRIFSHKDGMHYHGAHHALWWGGELFRKEIFTKLEGVKLNHVWKERGDRDPIRHQCKGAYYRKLTSEEEAGFRQQFNL